jgi:hypothetical protein
MNYGNCHIPFGKASSAFAITTPQSVDPDFVIEAYDYFNMPLFW